MDYKFKTEPYEHQLTALGASHNRENFALFMEMGTGKSKVLIDNIAMLYDKGKINAALIVAPKGVYHNWERQELPIHMPAHVLYQIITWSPVETKKQQAALKKLFIHDEDLVIFLMNIEAFSTKKGMRIAEKFLLAHSALMAIDESTTIKSPTASRTKSVLKLRVLAKYRRILTGAPVTKSPLDLYTQCFFLDPDLLDFSSYYTFKNRYAIMVDRNVGTHSFKHVMGYQRLDELNGKLNDFSYRVLKEDCLDLPEKVYMKRMITLTPEQKRMYGEMKKFALSELEGKKITATSVLAQLVRLHQITCGHLTLDDGDIRTLKNNRIKELLDILEETDGKIIIWAVYRHDIKEITKILSERYGANAVESFFGDTLDRDRQDIIDRFQDRESDLRFFVGNPKTGGYGLTLTASHTVIYYSNSYDLETRLQSEDRAHRISQDKKVTYIDLITEGTVDELIVKNLRGKINLATKIMGEDLKKWLI
jgi:SNF2 family DNA or RNA helicase|tara:strand:- start:85 stop:1521 length:1437 start_codon:yes stop_codon:yes gene_type:complete